MSDIMAKLLMKPNFFAMSGVPETLIEQAEDALNLRFADEYREYLAAFGVASVYGHELTGICASPRLHVVDVTREERTHNPAILADWYVVEQAKIDGIVVWQSTEGEVWQTMPNALPIKLCNSLCEYLEL